jgi:alpha-galactosidase
VGIVKARLDELMHQESQYLGEGSSAFTVKSKKEIALDKKRQQELKKLRVQMGKIITQVAFKSHYFCHLFF